MLASAGTSPPTMIPETCGGGSALLSLLALPPPSMPPSPLPPPQPRPSATATLAVDAAAAPLLLLSMLPLPPSLRLPPGRLVPVVNVGGSGPGQGRGKVGRQERVGFATERCRSAVNLRGRRLLGLDIQGVLCLKKTQIKNITF